MQQASPCECHESEVSAKSLKEKHTGAEKKGSNGFG